MNSLSEFLSTLSGFIWGPIMLWLLVGTGVFLTIGLGFMPLRRIGYGFALLWQGRTKTTNAGDISRGST